MRRQTSISTTLILTLAVCGAAATALAQVRARSAAPQQFPANNFPAVTFPGTPTANTPGVVPPSGTPVDRWRTPTAPWQSAPSGVDPATLQAWQQQIAKLYAARGVPLPGSSLLGRVDISGGVDGAYELLMAPSSAMGDPWILKLPENVKIGAWLTDGPINPMPDGVDPKSASLRQVVRTQMNNENLAAAMNQHPASEGWRTMWLNKDGSSKVWIQAPNACVASAVVQAITKPRPVLDFDRPTVTESTGDVQSSPCFFNNRDRNAIVTDGYAVTQPMVTSDSGELRFTLDGGRSDHSISAQMQLLDDSVRALGDERGVYARAIALTRLTLPGDSRPALDELARVYLKHPALVRSLVTDEFDAASLRRVRDFVTRAVGQARASGNAVEWVGVAALMSMEGRNELALKMLQRAGDGGALAPSIKALEDELTKAITDARKK